jgi:hypothetical protein
MVDGCAGERLDAEDAAGHGAADRLGSDEFGVG